MKQFLLVSLVSLVSFVGGLVVHSGSQAQKSSNRILPIAQETSTPTRCSEQEEFPKLIEDKYVTKFNGRRLRLDYDSGILSDYVPFAVNSAKVTPLRDGNLLLSLGDTLYKLTNQNKVLWRYYTAQVILITRTLNQRT